MELQNFCGLEGVLEFGIRGEIAGNDRRLAICPDHPSIREAHEAQHLTPRIMAGGYRKVKFHQILTLEAAEDMGEKLLVTSC